ncbi:MAG: peptidylprolyl isomerase [Tabrizicola sp.]|nr:peptidylprolyl isomerase [Tabrizicola sp.]
MAKTPEAETKRPVSKSKNTAAWIVVGLLIFGLGGFGVTNFSGLGGIGGRNSSVGSVGDTKITIDDYARAVREEVNVFSQQIGQPIGMQAAISFGLDSKALQGLVATTALDDEAQRVGLSVGDETVANALMSMDRFAGTSGTFDREAYRFTLERNNQTEAEYEASLRRSVARSILQGAIVGGFTAPDALTDALYAYGAERRGFSMLRLTEADLAAPLAEPTEEELRAFHEANIATFTKPEAKRITYAALLPEAIAKDQPVDEAALKTLYDERIDEFVVPERRLVERLIYPDQAAAEAAKTRLDAGEAFETLVTERGLTLDAIDLGDVGKAELGQAGDAVFAAAETDVVGPVTTDLGPALFRVNAILAGEETSFDEARELLAEEMKTDAARRAIADRIEEIDNELAAGATLAELGTQFAMTVATVDYVPGGQGGEGIAAYAAFRTAADAVTPDDFPEAIVLEDGGAVALQLDEIVAPAPIPFEEAREDVAAAWRADALSKALSAHAVEVKAEIEAGKAIGSFGIVDVTPDITRNGFIENVPATLMSAVFEMAKGDVRVIEEGEFVALVTLNSILPASTDGEDSRAEREALAARIQQAIAQDVFTSFTNAVTSDAGISLDQAAISAVNESFR